MREPKDFNRVLFLVLNAGLGYFYFGFNSVVLNTIQGNISDVFGWNQDQKLFYINCLNTVIPLGGLIGSLFSGTLLNKYGRRKTIMITSIFSSLGNILTLITEINIMIIGRTIVGLGIGIYSVAIPQYISEVSPPQYQGYFSTIYHQFLIGSEFLALLIGIGVPKKATDDDLLWKFMLAIPLLTNLILFLILQFKFMQYLCKRFNANYNISNQIIHIFFEIVQSQFQYNIFRLDTPIYYIQQQQQQSAIKILQQIYSEKDADSYLQELIEQNSRRNTNIQITEIFKLRYRKMLKVGLVIHASAQFSGFIMLMFYSNKILMENGDNISSQIASIFSSCYLLIAILTTLIMTSLINKYHRRQLLCLGLSICMFSILAIIICQLSNAYTVPKFIFFIFFIGFEIGPDQILFVSTVEILPEFGVSFCFAFQWLCQLFILLIFPILIEKTSLGFNGSFSIFVIVTFLLIIYLWIYLPDSRGKNPSDYFQEAKELQIVPFKREDHDQNNNQVQY